MCICEHLHLYLRVCKLACLITTMSYQWPEILRRLFALVWCPWPFSVGTHDTVVSNHLIQEIVELLPEIVQVPLFVKKKYTVNWNGGSKLVVNNSLLVYIFWYFWNEESDPPFCLEIVVNINDFSNTADAWQPNLLATGRLFQRKMTKHCALVWPFQTEYRIQRAPSYGSLHPTEPYGVHVSSICSMTSERKNNR